MGDGKHLLNARDGLAEATELAAKRAAVELLRAVQAFVRVDRSANPEIAALGDAATIFSFTGTLAGWADQLARRDAHPDAPPSVVDRLDECDDEVSSPRPTLRLLSCGGVGGGHP
jgi:hypothetical protein